MTENVARSANPLDSRKVLESSVPCVSTSSSIDRRTAACRCCCLYLKSEHGLSERPGCLPSDSAGTGDLGQRSAAPLRMFAGAIRRTSRAPSRVAAPARQGPAADQDELVSSAAGRPGRLDDGALAALVQAEALPLPRQSLSLSQASRDGKKAALHLPASAVGGLAGPRRGFSEIRPHRSRVMAKEGESGLFRCLVVVLVEIFETND